ncbi:unnamed protein product [Discosporangium mesarthrocarpum]
MDLCRTERLAWAALTVAVILVPFVPRLFALVEHGKLKRRVSGGGGGFPFNVPKRWFTHFYAFALLVNSIALTDIIVSGGATIVKWLQSHSSCSTAFGRNPESPRAISAGTFLCLCMMQFHVTRRLWECLCITRWGDAKMSVFSYPVGGGSIPGNSRYSHT